MKRHNVGADILSGVLWIEVICNVMIEIQSKNYIEYTASIGTRL